MFQSSNVLKKQSKLLCVHVFFYCSFLHVDVFIVSIFFLFFFFTSFCCFIILVEKFLINLLRTQFQSNTSNLLTIILSFITFSCSSNVHFNTLKLFIVFMAFYKIVNNFKGITPSVSVVLFKNSENQYNQYNLHDRFITTTPLPLFLFILLITSPFLLKKISGHVFNSSAHHQNNFSTST